MLWHVLLMISDLAGVIPAFLHQEGAHHVHTHINALGDALRVTTKHLIITVQYR